MRGPEELISIIRFQNNRPSGEFCNSSFGTPSAEFLRHVTFAPDARTLASCCDDGFVYLWISELAQEITRLKVPFDAFAKIRLSADGRKLAVVTISDTKDGNPGTQYTADVFIWSGLEGD